MTFTLGNLVIEGHENSNVLSMQLDPKEEERYTFIRQDEDEDTVLWYTTHIEEEDPAPKHSDEDAIIEHLMAEGKVKQVSFKNGLEGVCFHQLYFKQRHYIHFLNESNRRLQNKMTFTSLINYRIGELEEEDPEEGESEEEDEPNYSDDESEYDESEEEEERTEMLFKIEPESKVLRWLDKKEAKKPAKYNFKYSMKFI